MTHDLHTRHEARSCRDCGAISGAMASAYRTEIGRRTRRGLESRTRGSKSAAGRAYGYIPPALSGTAQKEIDEAQAEDVRRILRHYADRDRRARASPTIAARLTTAESELERLLVAARAAGPSRVVDVTPLLRDLPVRSARAVDKLEETLASGDVHRARAEIRAHAGTVAVEADAREIRLYSDQSAMAAALLRTAGGNASLCGSGGSIRHLLARISRRPRPWRACPSPYTTRSRSISKKPQDSSALHIR